MIKIIGDSPLISSLIVTTVTDGNACRKKSTILGILKIDTYEETSLKVALAANFEIERKGRGRACTPQHQLFK